MVTTTRTQETGYEALARLANKARSEGVKLYRDQATGTYVATSGTDAAKAYVVTPHTCECQGFASHGRCKHIGALHAAIGWIAKSVVMPAPVVTIIVGETIPATPVCTHCDGRGYQIKARRIGRGEFVREDVPCPLCTAAKVAA